MFTGIIEDAGEVIAFDPSDSGARIVIAHKLGSDIAEGESISVSGCCLTALAIESERFSADVSLETLRRTNLAEKTPGTRVNLERALAAGARMGGHIVQGHVDGVARIDSLQPLGDEHWWFKVLLPDGLSRYVVEKGSIAIDGISLTVAALDAEVVSVTVIPHTYLHTSLRDSRKGTAVNIEVDIVAKYVEKLTDGYLR